MSNSINSFRNTVNPLELDLRFSTSSCWGNGEGMGVQCRVRIPVSSAGSFIHFFICSNYYIIPYYVLDTKDTIVSMTKNSPHFVDLMRIHKRMGRKQEFNNQFQGSIETANLSSNSY